MKSVLVALVKFSKDAVVETSLVAVSSLLYLAQEFSLELEKIALPAIGKIVVESRTLNETLRSGNWTYRGALGVLWEKAIDLPETLRERVKTLLVLMFFLILVGWRSIEEILVVSTLFMVLVYN